VVFDTDFLLEMPLDISPLYAPDVEVSPPGQVDKPNPRKSFVVCSHFQGLGGLLLTIFGGTQYDSILGGQSSVVFDTDFLLEMPLDISPLYAPES
jgi:hypothetical protein